jgi:hypothetical protein
MFQARRCAAQHASAGVRSSTLDVGPGSYGIVCTDTPAAGLSQLVHAQRLQRPLYHIACARLYTIWNTMFAIDLSNSGWSTYRVHLDPGAKMDFRTLTMYYYGGCSSSMDGVYCMDHLSILNS